jgi:hypothetical protein
MSQRGAHFIRRLRERYRWARQLFADPYRYLLDWRGSPERPLLPALLVFTAMVACWAALMAVAGWRQTPLETSGQVAFTLSPEVGDQALLGFEQEGLASASGILDWRRVPAGEMAAILAELVPNSQDILPELPHLYEVSIDARFDSLGFITSWQERMTGLRYQTLKAPPLAPVKPLPWPWIAVLMADLFASLCITAMALNMSLRIQSDSLAILHQLGADDALIAQHFRGHLLRLTLRPLILGSALGLLAFWGWSGFRRLQNQPHLSFEVWYALLVPLITLLFLAGLLTAAQQAVMRSLRERY